MHSKNKKFNHDKACISLSDNQPKANLSLGYFFKSALTKPEFYLKIVAIAACFIAPAAVSIPIAITVLILDIIFAVGRFILIPTASFFGKKLTEEDIKHQNAEVTLADGVKLRGIWKRNDQNLNKENENRKLLIVFGGKGTVAGRNSYAELQRDKYDLIQMNYRGTNNSDGLFTSHKTHVNDGIEIVGAAKKLGYRDISLVGHSLGGSIAPHIKGYLDRETEGSVPLYVYNTFRRIDEFISCKYKNPVVKVFIKLTTKFFLKWIGWDYHFQPKDWNRLKGIKKVVGAGSYDKTIPPKIDLAAAMKLTDPENAFITDAGHHDFPGLMLDLLHPETEFTTS